MSQQLPGEGEVCEAAASDQAALKTQSLTTNTPPSPPTTTTITITTTTTTTTPATTTTTTTTTVTPIPTNSTESDEINLFASVSDDKSLSNNNSSDSGSQTEGNSAKNSAPIENKAVRVLLAPVENTHNRSQNILFRNVVIANNHNIVNPSHNFTIHHHFSGVTTPNQYVQNEPIIITGQSQTQQSNTFNVQNIIGQNNHNIIQFPNYSRFPSQLHLDISNRAPNVTIRAFEAGGLSHLTRNHISNHGQTFIHRPMTLALPQNQGNPHHISEIKILHSASNTILQNAPQIIQSQPLDSNNLTLKSDDSDKVLSVDANDGNRTSESKEQPEPSQTLVDQNSNQDSSGSSSSKIGRAHV